LLYIWIGVTFLCVARESYKEFEAEKRWWSWEKGYERGQGMRMRMSQDYGRCRNGKRRNVSCALN
jgi:hypothetical protein